MPAAPPTVHRNLVNRPVAALGAAVGRAPAVVVGVVVALTVVMLVLSGQAQEAVGDEGFMPDTPEVNASQILAERFNGSHEEVVQVLVDSEGSTLVSADGLAAAAAIEDAVRAAEPPARLADIEGRPGIVSWLFPAQHALSTAPGPVDDADVVTAYDAVVAELPENQAAFATALLPEGADADSADSALLFVFVNTDGLADDAVAAWEEIVEITTSIADAVESAALPAGVTARAFSPYLMMDDEVFQAELGRLFGSAFVIIMLILGFVYWVRPAAGMSRVRSGRRSAADMLLSLAAIVMAILWMLGAATLLGPGFLEVTGGMTEFTQVIPILLIGLGVDYAIHLTSRYREEVGSGASVGDGIRAAVATVGGALALATVATAVGFLTNVFNPLPALRDFGVLAAVGIVAAFAITLTFVPAARLLLDRRAERSGRLPDAALGHSSERLLPGLMARTAFLAHRAPVPTLAVTVLLAGLGVFGMTQLETRFSQTDFVPEGSPVLDTLDDLAERFNGGYGETTEILLTGPVATPAGHNALVDVHDALADVDGVVVRGDVANAHSVVTLLMQLAAPGPDGQPIVPAVAEAAAAAGLGPDLTVPEDADVAGLYAAVEATAPDAAGEVLAGDRAGFDHARIVVQTTAGEEHAGELIDALTEALAPVEAAGVTAIATSSAIMNEVVITAIEDSQISSLAITLLVAMLLLVTVFAYEQRRPLLGVITIIPVALVVLWTFGMMAATGIPFGPITATIAALAIGIGLPYAIHVTHRFTEDRGRHADVGAAIRSTVRHTGGAMAGSAFTTMAGFGILVTSSLLPFRQLGSVMVYAVGLSLVAATLVLPSILVLWDRWHQRKTAESAIHLDDRELEMV